MVTIFESCWQIKVNEIRYYFMSQKQKIAHIFYNLEMSLNLPQKSRRKYIKGVLLRFFMSFDSV